jgi:hypothetical protein
MPPFEVVLSRPPVSVAIEARPRDEELPVSAAKQEFLERLKTLRTGPRNPSRFINQVQAEI